MLGRLYCAVTIIPRARLDPKVFGPAVRGLWVGPGRNCEHQGDESSDSDLMQLHYRNFALHPRFPLSSDPEPSVGLTLEASPIVACSASEYRTSSPASPSAMMPSAKAFMSSRVKSWLDSIGDSSLARRRTSCASTWTVAQDSPLARCSASMCELNAFAAAGARRAAMTCNIMALAS